MNQQNEYSPYWILNPLINNIKITKFKDWTFCSSLMIKKGSSPLGELGGKFYQLSHEQISLYDHCVWVFSNKKLTPETNNKLARVFKSVTEAFLDTYVSSTGVIITVNNKVAKQPASPQYYESISNDTLDDEKLTRIINIVEYIFKHDLTKYLDMFDYLSEIKKSGVFIRELALCSFIEEHWLVKQQSKNKFTESLQALVAISYDKENSKSIQFYLKWICFVYLLYLGWKIVGSFSNDEKETGKPLKFYEAALFQFVNPKAWVMATSAVSAYTYAASDIFIQVVYIALIFLIVAFPCVGIWLVFGAGLKKYLKSSRHQRTFNLSMAFLLVASILPVINELINQYIF